MSRGKPVVLSEKKIDAMDPGEEMWDALITGLHIRAGNRGKSFLYFYTTLAGKQRRPSIGKYGPVTLTKAREIAKEWGGIVAEGNDPMEIREEKKAELPPPTLKDLKAKYDEAEAQSLRLYEVRKARGFSEEKGRGKRRKAFTEMKPSTVKKNQGLWKHLTDFFEDDKKLTAFTKQDMQALHASISEKKDRDVKGPQTGGPVAANRTVTFLAALFGRALDWELLKTDMASIFSAVDLHAEIGNERYIQPEEMKLFLKTLEGWYASGEVDKKNTARLAILLGNSAARLNEIMSSRLSWVDWANGTLLVRDNKSKKARTFALGKDALVIIKDRADEWQKAGADLENDFLIPGRIAKQPMKSPYKGWAKFCKEAKIDGVTPHTLRHTWMTYAIGIAGASLEQASRVTGHKHMPTALRYTHTVLEQTRQLQDDVADKIREMAKGEINPVNDIIPDYIRQQRNNIRKLQEASPSTSAH